MKRELPPQERKERLETAEQIRECMQGILSAARSEEEAKQRIRSALDGQSFLYLGPMISWNTGAMGALIDRFQALPAQKRAVLAKRMIDMLDTENKHTSAENALQHAPPLLDAGVDAIDMRDEVETRKATVCVLFPGATQNITIDCVVRVDTDANKN